MVEIIQSVLAMLGFAAALVLLGAGWEAALARALHIQVDVTSRHAHAFRVGDPAGKAYLIGELIPIAQHHQDDDERQEHAENGRYSAVAAMLGLGASSHVGGACQLGRRSTRGS